MTAPATKADLEKLGTAIDGLAGAMRASGEEQAALLREFVEVNRQRGGHVQTVNVPPPPAPQRSERLVPLLVVLVVLLMMAVVATTATSALQGQRITDMRADHAREIDRLERRHEALGAWSREESNITRGYIWTGKVPVANPYPSEASE